MTGFTGNAVRHVCTVLAVMLFTAALTPVPAAASEKEELSIALDLAASDAEKAQRQIRAAQDQGRMDEAVSMATDGAVASCARLMAFLAEAQEG